MKRLRQAIHAAPIWFLLTVVSCAAAIAIFLFRADLLWFEYQPATIGDIYAPPPGLGPRITGFENNGGRLTVKIEPRAGCEGWRVMGPEGAVTESAGDNPVIPMVKGRHRYQVMPTGCIGLSSVTDQAFDISYTPASDAAEVQFSHDIFNIYRTPVPVAPRTGPGLARWIPPLADYDNGEVARAQRLLDDMGLRREMSSFEKMRTITVGLLERAKPGLPPSGLDAMSPMRVIDAALGAGIPVFCRQRALMKAFLLNVAGVPTRLVWTGRTFDGAILSSHAFTESYIVEQGRWAYSDLSHHLAYVTSPGGLALNGYELLTVAAVGGLSGDALNWKGLIRRPGHPDERPPKHLLNSLAGTFNPNAMLQYWSAHDRFPQQIAPPYPTKLAYRAKRYLFEPTLYIGPERGYALHWLRGASILSALGCALIFSLLAWRRRL